MIAQRIPRAQRREDRGALRVAVVALAWLSLVSASAGCEVGLGSGAAAGTTATKEARDDLLARVDLAEIAPRTFVHTSFHDLPEVGIFPSNGLLVCANGEGVLVDTAWGDAPTAHLLDEATRRGCPVKHAIFTHFHDDRTGGLTTLFARGVHVHATEATTKLLARPGFAPETIVPPTTLTLGGVAFEVLFPGPAHAPDNVVVYLPASRVLFGGCMVKAASAKSLGNVKDASLAEWPASIAKVTERYGDKALGVVPGHGDPGGPELLAHTARLLAGASAR